MTPMCDAVSIVRASNAANFHPSSESIGEAAWQQVSLLKAHGGGGAALTDGRVGLKIGLTPARVCGR
jgi:hypothetical protein